MDTEKVVEARRTGSVLRLGLRQQINRLKAERARLDQEISLLEDVSAAYKQAEDRK